MLDEVVSHISIFPPVSLMLFLLVILHLHLSGNQASPLRFTEPDVVLGFSPQSLPVCKDTRSLWDIIWSCLVTSFACSWVSVHPNMPGPGEGKITKGMRRLELMFWAVMSPELVIMWAIRQWLGARRLKRKYRKYGWTKTHGYFIQMGGFRLYHGNISKGILSPQMLETLLERGKINMPTITEEEILDRSKGDGLAKFLVIIQTTWFIIQSVARLASHLVLTQIELMTLAFAALNGIMYYFWWNKPLDVQSTVAVYLVEPFHQDEIDDFPLENNGIEAEQGVELFQLLPPNTTPPLPPLEEMPPTNWRAIPYAIANFPRVIYRLLEVAGVITVMERMEKMAQLRSNPVVDGLERIPTFYALPTPITPGYDTVNTGIVAIVSAIGGLFGAIHCAGWVFPFPTEAEATTWRVLSLVVAGTPLWGFWYLYMYTLNLHIRNPEMKIVRGNMQLGDIFEAATSSIGFFTPFYLLARIGLLVEAFIALRDLPASAYDVVAWTTILPHI